MCNKAVGINWDKVKRDFFNEIDLTQCNGCDSCYLRCDKDIPMTQEEYLHIRGYVHEKCHDDLREIVCQDKRVDMGDGVYFQLCRFLDMSSHRCSIYPVRPLVCRVLGHVEWMPCPIEKIKNIASTEVALKLMKTYALNERKTYEDWESLERIHDR